MAVVLDTVLEAASAMDTVESGAGIDIAIADMLAATENGADIRFMAAIMAIAGTHFGC